MDIKEQRALCELRDRYNLEKHTHDLLHERYTKLSDELLMLEREDDVDLNRQRGKL